MGDARKIDFLIIGAQKAGTSTIDGLLRQHPNVQMATNKELHFFDNESNFQSGVVDYAKYESQFNWNDPEKKFGESTPIYMYWDKAIKRIWEYNKNIKLIIILRNPIERAFSHWNMEKSKGKDKATLMEAITNEEIRSKECLPFQHRIFSYIDRGMYSSQIRNILRFFEREQLLFIKYEEFILDNFKTIESISDFLGLPFQKELFQIQILNQGVYQEAISSNEFKYLCKIFRNDIMEVERLLGWNCKDWVKHKKNRTPFYDKYINNWRSRFHWLTRS